MAPGQEASFKLLGSNPRSFGSKCAVLKKGICTSLLLSLIPCTCIVLRGKFSYFTRSTRGFESMKKHWCSKLAFKTLKKYWIWPKCACSNKKYGNFKFSHSLIWILHFPPMTVSQIFFALCYMYKIKKMKMSDGNKVFSFGIEKVMKIIFEHVWEPWFQLFDISCFCFFSCKSHYFAWFSGKVTIHRQLPGVTISRNVWSKNRFFLVHKKLKNRVVKHQPNPLQGYRAAKRHP